MVFAICGLCGFLGLIWWFSLEFGVSELLFDLFVLMGLVALRRISVELAFGWFCLGYVWLRIGVC